MKQMFVKKLRTIAIAAATAMLTLSSVAASAFSASATEPDINAFLSFDNVETARTIHGVSILPGDIKVSVNFTNFTGANNFAVVINFESGYDAPYYTEIEYDQGYNRVPLNVGTAFDGMVCSTLSDNSDAIGIAGAHDSVADNPEGTYVSFYLRKNATFNSENSEISLDVRSLHFQNDNGEITAFEDDIITPPTVSTLYDFLLGNFTNDTIVDADNATLIMRQLRDHGNLSTVSVATVQASLSGWFPSAVCAAAADTNEDGFINEDDVDEIMHYYVVKMLDENATVNNNVGHIRYHIVYAS